MLHLNEQVRKLEQELKGTYKDNQASTMQILELTKKLNESETEKKELEGKLSAANEYNTHNATLIINKVCILTNFHSLKRSTSLK